MSDEGISPVGSLDAADVPEGMSRFMVTFRANNAHNVYVVAHSREKAKELARKEQHAQPHAARKPDSTIVSWDPEGIPRDQWVFSSDVPQVVIDDFIHDPVNTNESLQKLISRVETELETCPRCGDPEFTVAASVAGVFLDGRIKVNCKSCPTQRVPITVELESQKNYYKSQRP